MVRLFLTRTRHLNGLFLDMSLGLIGMHEGGASSSKAMEVGM